MAESSPVLLDPMPAPRYAVWSGSRHREMSHFRAQNTAHALREGMVHTCLCFPSRPCKYQILPWSEGSSVEAVGEVNAALKDRLKVFLGGMRLAWLELL